MNSKTHKFFTILFCVTVCGWLAFTVQKYGIEDIRIKISKSSQFHVAKIIAQRKSKILMSGGDPVSSRGNMNPVKVTYSFYVEGQKYTNSNFVSNTINSDSVKVRYKILNNKEIISIITPGGYSTPYLEIFYFNFFLILFVLVICIKHFFELKKK